MSKEQEKRKDLLAITVTARIFHFDDSTTRQKKTHRHPYSEDTDTIHVFSCE